MIHNPARGSRQAAEKIVGAIPGPPPVIPQTAEPARAETHTYGQILRSSALIGGVSVLTIAIGVIRTKAMALLLGPAGFGLMGLYGSIIDLGLSVAGMGVNSSGVRQIAEAVGSGDMRRIARTVMVLRRVSILLGILGAALLVVFSSQVAQVTFGDDQHVIAVALLSLALFFRLIADGQGALIQGMRRIADLAKMGSLGALLGTTISISLVYALGEKGLAPSLVAGAATGFAISWWYSRKVRIQPVAMTGAEIRREAASLLKLGSSFMVTGFLMMGAAYAVRAMVLRMVGWEAAGLYQAAWTLGGLYVGIMLQAMGSDFYPRLTGVGRNNVESNRLVNEQAQVSLLLAGPGVIATLTFAPLVIALFYSTNFGPATDVLRWICLGMTLRVVSWPIGFIVVARGEQRIFVLTEMAWAAANIGLAWVCVKLFGVSGAGIAFFGAYVCHVCMIYPVGRHLTGFRWSVANRRTGAVFLSLIAMVFGSFYVLPPWVATSFGGAAAVLSAIYSVRVLLTLVGMGRVPPPVQRLLRCLGGRALMRAGRVQNE